MEEKIDSGTDDRRRIAVYAGGIAHSNQRTYFENALERLKDRDPDFENKFHFDMLQSVDLHKLDEDPGVAEQVLARFFMQADGYMIIGHIHQVVKLDEPLLYQNLSFLQAFNGFPRGIHIECPVFTQDKFVYICACRRYTIPTFKILYDDIHEENFKGIYSFTGTEVTLDEFQVCFKFSILWF